MIEKFEEMQEYGQPPAPLLNAFGGESPFNLFTQQSNSQQNSNSNNNNNIGGNPQDACNIF
ncbi:hypothetical protein IMG5_135120 [Ichthyophthirius multifiliis]|uniref:Uncharacterized protein n=1 Tax=Ichthyophthirius multifiliis TaxID=5932 RepID=G0QWU0_ICHMU|nr:hypothetical protein IMG5_135120 [Ichthyophthirius multifiliis]EGR30315.1 hypothetical protein IMG5_135120 [Ichthyophthirius multifiliis]|eukprot:XP_004031902.1 hypothetical protein IMG5_135120 [Ichthyophthirius multifiliis]